MNDDNIRFSHISMLTGLKRHTLNARAKTLLLSKNVKRNSGNQILLNAEQVRYLLEDRINTIKGKVIYIGNLKGGVGKTTIAYLIVNALSSLGLKTCIIDLDTQANLTQQYINVSIKQPVFHDIIDNRISIEEAIIKLTPNLHILPSSLRNSLIQKILSLQSPKNHLTWFNHICLNYLRKTYEVIVVDTPPHLTTLNSVFCLCLKDIDNILIPACAEDFSIMGIQMFLEDIQDIKKSYEEKSNPKISIVINRFLQNQKTNLEMLSKIGQIYTGMLSEVIIKDSAKIRESIIHKTPLTEIKQGKEIFEIISNLLQEFNILKKIET